jgi:hypothetical protein
MNPEDLMEHLKKEFAERWDAIEELAITKKALKLATEILCNPRDAGCPPFQVGDLPCTCPECWQAYLLQEVSEEKCQ